MPFLWADPTDIGQKTDDLIDQTETLFQEVRALVLEVKRLRSETLKRCEATRALLPSTDNPIIVCSRRHGTGR
jgi:hypothetical protein